MCSRGAIHSRVIHKMALSSDSERELTAYHEAGHIFVGILHGGRLKLASLEPEEDEGPRRFGDTTMAWRKSIRERSDFPLILCEVALAGPMAETIYSGDETHPAHVPQWQPDWRNALQMAERLMPDLRKQIEFLEDRCARLHRFLREDHHWSAIGDIADLLMCHDVVEHDDVIDLIQHWRR